MDYFVSMMQIKIVRKNLESKMFAQVYVKVIQMQEKMLNAGHKIGLEQLFLDHVKIMNIAMYPAKIELQMDGLMEFVKPKTQKAELVFAILMPVQKLNAEVIHIAILEELITVKPETEDHIVKEYVKNKM